METLDSQLESVKSAAVSTNLVNYATHFRSRFQQYMISEDSMGSKELRVGVENLVNLEKITLVMFTVITTQMVGG